MTIRRWAAWCVVMLTMAMTSACAAKMQPHEGLFLDEMLETPQRVMWVAAHPDDESFAGSILAKTAYKAGGELYFFVLTHGDGGACHIPGGCNPDLPTVRGKELAEVARLYGATLQHEYYFNAPLPVESIPDRHEIAKVWMEQGDPTPKIAAAIRKFKPTVILALSPDHGGTGHPEHQLACRFAMAGVRMAADGSASIPGEAYRVPNAYYVLNKIGLSRMIGMDDPEIPNENFKNVQICESDGTMTCQRYAIENTKPHHSQNADMTGMRLVTSGMWKTYLYKVDPFTEVKDPMEPARSIWRKD
ncbi:MAG: PIG-L family deacetylase [Deltaproteobacteria bacterium]|nr:PIG-L family deacetylase [bacterium]MCB9475241.1 PIG-L family deacetylase [Deltaproteobacteria bacterium]MCB9479477.1 PIG-L family deacetylase [Deltaproteobacteria bacterium]MCB9489640.1 PIG-L family deacetylase [Deltaproteobacteria bacterium]